MANMIATMTGRPRAGLSGPEGLLVSVILQAFIDAHDPTPEVKEPARAWFDSEDYQHYLTWLDLPADWQPEFQEHTQGK